MILHPPTAPSVSLETTVLLHPLTGPMVSHIQPPGSPLAGLCFLRGNDGFDRGRAPHVCVDARGLDPGSAPKKLVQAGEMLRSFSKPG